VIIRLIRSWPIRPPGTDVESDFKDYSSVVKGLDRADHVRFHMAVPGPDILSSADVPCMPGGGLFP